MPDVLNVLVAFVTEHQRCGERGGGRDGEGCVASVFVRGQDHPAGYFAAPSMGTKVTPTGSGNPWP
jgi:hypothetical protein